MYRPDDNLLIDYLAESSELLAGAETELLTMEREGAVSARDRVKRVFQAVHWVRGGASFFDLPTVDELAHRIEDTLTLIHARNAATLPDSIGVLLRAIDRLSELIGHSETSNQADIADLARELASLAKTPPAPVENGVAPADDRQALREGPLRILLVEDDFACRLLLQSFLSRYGDCHIAVNGREAVDAFRAAMDSERSYDLVCMDIMMPEMDGPTAVRHIRGLEEAQGTRFNGGTKIFMTTTVKEIKEVFRCFEQLCDAYLLKPIDLSQLLGKMKCHLSLQ